MSSWVFPLATSVLSLVFAAMVFGQYLGRRKMHQLVWSKAFFVFSFAAFCEFYSEVWGWNVPLYRLYYVSAAMLVALLGAGTVYLFSRRWGPVFLGLTVAVGAAMLAVAFVSPVDTAAFVPGITVGGEAMADRVRLFAPILTIPGSLALIGGAFYSWWRAGTFYNALIGLGGLIVAAAGSAARLGSTGFLYLGEMLGIVVLFWGFLKSREAISRREKGTGAAGPGAAGSDGPSA